MGKTNLKKALSVFLSVLMILSCWVWVAPHEHTHANAVSNNVKIAVPETIYLKPDTGAATEGQFYLNNDVDGNAVGAKTANAYSDAASVVVSGGTLKSV